MSGRSPHRYTVHILIIAMRSHQSYPNIPTVIHSYEYSTIIMSIIVPSRHTGIGAWVNSNLYTINSIYCIISLIFMQGYCTNTEYTGNLGYNSVCYITSRIRWAFKEKSVYPVMGEKQNKTFRWDQRLQSFQGKIRT